MPYSALPTSFQGWILLAFGVTYIGRGLWHLVRAMRTLSWPSTTGRIGHAGVDQQEDGVTDHVTYSYRVGSDWHVNDRLAIGPRLRFGSTSRFRTWLAEAYTNLDAVTVYCNPTRPADSVLRPGVSLNLAGERLLGIACIAFALLGQ